MLATFENVVDVRGVEVDLVIVIQSTAVIRHSILSNDERKVVVFYSDPVESLSQTRGYLVQPG